MIALQAFFNNLNVENKNKKDRDYSINDIDDKILRKNKKNAKLLKEMLIS